MKATLSFLRQRLSALYPPREVEAMIRVIFEELKGWSRVDVLMHKDSELSDYIKEKIARVVERLERNEPLQYVLGAAHFAGRRFRVTPATLIPRPETAQLVDIITERNSEATDLRVLDIGTGSGCIAITLALNLRFAQVTATDVSADALAVARGNAEELHARGVTFTREDILTAVPVPDSFDIIVSNPPYIARSEAATMERNVLDYEPHSALFVDDARPLLFYKAIARYAATALTAGGQLYLEINNRYAEDMRRLLADEGMDRIDIVRDLNGLYRFAIAIKPVKR